MIERRRHQEPVAGEVGCRADAVHDGPELARVRERHALGPAGRARGVEEHRDLVLDGPHRVERAGIEEVREAGSVQLHHRQAGWTGGPPLGIGEDEADLGVLEDVVDRVARQLEAHRHRDHARAHDAEIGREVFRAIGGEDGDAVAAPMSARHQAARHRPRRPVDLAVGPLARRRRLGEIDEGDLLGVGGPVEQVAEIVACAHARVGMGAAYRLKSSGVATAARHAAPTYGASCPASTQAWLLCARWRSAAACARA